MKDLGLAANVLGMRRGRTDKEVIVNWPEMCRQGISSVLIVSDGGK